MNKIAVIGLGYVGLPLAIEFGCKYETIGFDINKERITSLKKNIDINVSISQSDFEKSKKLKFTHHIDDLSEQNIFIVTVPTPTDSFNKPDFSPLIQASKIVGGVIKKGDIVIYESTVYPGATEEICVPVLEKYSSMKLNENFSVGYSPERINPGDKIYNVTNIVKVISGSNKEAIDKIRDLYTNGLGIKTHTASSIKVAEASKVIENIQRDVNIALVNEIALFLNEISLDTGEVLDAASTKWNFHNYKPGLVGGHCIGVDPYYYLQKAEQIGYKSNIIKTARDLNELIPSILVKKYIKELEKKNINLHNHKCLFLGLTFKENCPDIRNSGAIKFINNLSKYNLDIFAYDPYVQETNINFENNIKIVTKDFIENGLYDSVIVAVSHDEFRELGYKLKRNSRNGLIFDLKSIYSKEVSDFRL